MGIDCASADWTERKRESRGKGTPDLTDMDYSVFRLHGGLTTVVSAFSSIVLIFLNLGYFGF